MIMNVDVIWLNLIFFFFVDGSFSLTPTLCPSGATVCSDRYSQTGLGCCMINNAVCCNASGTCCPEGSTCSSTGCMPQHPIYPCGPVQGENCTASFVCHPGPLPWKSVLPTVLVFGDSVSIGYTPKLAVLLKNNASHPAFVTHTPASGDGGARSTSNAIQCMDVFFSTSNGNRLNFTKSDTIIFNFGLHDYNYGLGGVEQYGKELQLITKSLQKMHAKLLFLTTTPAHQSIEDNTVVISLNKRALSIMKTAGIPSVDTYQAIIKVCGNVPFHNCTYAQPKGVHYTAKGYEYLANTIANALGNTYNYDD